MKEVGGILVLNSGKQLCVNKNIIGISPELELYGGYDDDLFGWGEVTKEDRHEIAEYMIERWIEYKKMLEG